MIWKHHQPTAQLNNTEPAGTTSTSVIKKLGIPVSKLIGEPDKQAVDLQGYVQRMQPMQSILTIRPDQLRTGAENIDQEPGQRVKANSIESPPKSESPQKYEDDYNGENGHDQNMDEDKTGQIQRTSVITANRPIKHESGEKMDCGDGRHDHEGEESDEIDPGTDSQLQIDESEDVDVTEPDSKSIKLDSEQSYTDHTVKTGKIANWNLPSRKSPIQELLERHNLGHIGQSLAQAQQAQQQTTQSTAQSGQTQYSTLQSLYANPVFHQNLRTSVLQSRGITPQTLPLLLPQQGGVLNSQPKNLFLTTQHANGLAATTGMSNLEALKAQTQRPMVSPVGRSPIPTHGMCGSLATNGTTTTKNGKDKGPFSCSLCGRTFSLRGNLLRHERIHRGDKPFRCRFCNKAFIQRTDVLAHERVHTGEKPFACQFCGKRFPRRSTMKEHEKSFCRARVALEEGRKPILAVKDRTESESNSGEQSPASVSPPPTATQEAAAGLLAISGQIMASHQKMADHTMESSSGSHDSSSSGSKTTSPEHTSSGSGSPSNSTGTTDHNVESKTDKKPLDATDFSVKAVIAN